MTFLSRLLRKAPTTPTMPTPPPVAPAPTVQQRIESLADAPPPVVMAMAAGRDPQGATVPVALRQAAQVRIAELIDGGVLAVADVCLQMDTAPELLVAGGSSSRLRQLAAQAIVDPAQIRQLLKQVRDKDRGVYKILKRKSDALQAAERAVAETAAVIGARAAALESHSRRTPDADYETTLERLVANWQALEVAADSATDERVQQAIQRCREIAAAQRRELEARAAERAAARTQVEARERERRAALDAAASQAAAEAEAAAQVLREAAASEAAEAAAREAERAAAEHRWRRLGGLIGMAQRAVGEGNTQKAARLRRELSAKWPAEGAVPASLTRQLQQLDARLTDLKEWKDYAVAPKRIELIEAMESLVNVSEEPRALAAQIRSLQDEWRTISKGIASEAAEEWERFQRASQAAFEPCRVYFEAQAALREENLQHRQGLLERLAAVEAAHGGEEADWRLLATVVREAPLEWRRRAPVDRDANQPLQDAFEASIGRLQSRLDAWHERNATAKGSLIKRAQQLLGSGESEAVDGVKRLQQLWKDTGPASRGREQELWSEFRAACDAVFEKRQAAHAQQAAALETNRQAAVALCESAEGMASRVGAELLEAGKAVPTLRAQFDALGELPRADARALKQRFARALKACEEAVARQRRLDDELAAQNLIDAGRQVRRIEQAHADAASSEERSRLDALAQTFIAAVPYWPVGGLSLLKGRLTQADKPPVADPAARERALRLLCIRGEILAEVPSPKDDESLRRQYQVERLMQGMGGGVATGAGDWQAMLLEWVAIPAVAPALHDELEQRFLRNYLQGSNGKMS